MKLYFEISNNTDGRILDIIDKNADLIDSDVCDFVQKTAQEIWKDVYWFGYDVFYDEDNYLYSKDEIKRYWDKNHTTDPSMEEYSNFNDWFDDSIENMYYYECIEDDEDEIIPALESGLHEWLDSIGA